MKQSPNTKQNFSSDKTKIMLVIIFLAILLFAFGILLGLLIRQRMQQPAVQTSPITSPQSIAPTVFVPTVDCGSPTFVLGSTTFQIQNLTIAPDGSLTVPVDASGVAYWLEGPEGNYLVVLSPTPENIALETTLTAENIAKITWADCSSRTFNLSAQEPNPANISSLPSQLTSGLTIFFQTDSSGNGLIVRGDLSEMIFP